MQIARSLYQQQGDDARATQAIDLIARFQLKIDSSGLQVDFLKAQSIAEDRSINIEISE